jgi:hypothetical protein
MPDIIRYVNDLKGVIVRIIFSKNCLDHIKVGDVSDGVEMQMKENGGGEKTLALIEVSKVPLTFRKLLRTGLPLIVNPCKYIYIYIFSMKMKRNRKALTK